MYVPTRYELAISRGSENYLVLYCGRKTRQSLYKCCVQKAEALARLAGTSTLHFAKRVADGATMGDWAIKFTGRTQRQAEQEGELPFVWKVDAPQQLVDSKGGDAA